MTQSWRNVLGVAIALVATLGVLAIHQLLFRPPPPPSREYALTGLVLANYTWGVAAVLLAVGFAVGFAVRAHPIAAGVGFVAVQACATIYEIHRYPTSHNMLPFDVISWGVLASPLVLGAFVGNRLRQRVASQRAASPTRADDVSAER